MRPDDVRRADVALAKVVRDLGQLESPPEGLRIALTDDYVHVATSGDRFTCDIDPELDDARLLVQVADAVQEQVSYGIGDPVWPVCVAHNFGLHPETRSGRAVWVCRPRHHVVSTIGELCPREPD